MRIIVKNTKCKAVIGGTDNLLGFDLLKKLRKYMRVRPKDYSRAYAYQEGRWDGWQYFITPAGSFATGFLPMLYAKAIKLGAKVTIEDQRVNLPQLQEELSDYIGCVDGIEQYARGKYAYQFRIFQSLRNYIKLGEGTDFYFPRGILDCATNAGKTSMSALIVNNLVGQNRVVFMVSDRGIYKQSVDFFSQIIGEPVGEVKAGGKIDLKWFTVCMVKSLLNATKDNNTLKNWLAKVDVLIVDESDEAGAKQYAKTISMINAGMRVFVSGTPLDGESKVNKMIQLGLSGMVLDRISKRELIDLGVSQDPIIHMMLNRSRDAAYSDYKEEMYYNIHTSKQRVELVCKKIEEKHLHEQSVVTFTIREHGEFMLEYISKRFPTLCIEIVHGKIKGPERDDLLDRYKAGKIDILLGSMVLKRGLNLPSIRALFLTHGGKSKTTVKQLLGRAERHDKVHEEVAVYDMWDTGKWVSKHSRKRITFYKSEQLKVHFEYEHKRYKPV